jgi:tetratricopeptide (TPR) repeat protein
MSFSIPDLHHLRAAQGWLELGDWQSANDELENIAAPMRGHPDVLKLRFAVYSAAKHWDIALAVAESLVTILPDDPHSWINRSFVLHELERTREAQMLLLPALKKFRDEWHVPYNLACYACQLGQIDMARRLLKRAFFVGDAKSVKLAALADPAFAPLWTAEQLK